MTMSIIIMNCIQTYILRAMDVTQSLEVCVRIERKTWKLLRVKAVEEDKAVGTMATELISRGLMGRKSFGTGQ